MSETSDKLLTSSIENNGGYSPREIRSYVDLRQSNLTPTFQYKSAFVVHWIDECCQLLEQAVNIPYPAQASMFYTHTHTRSFMLTQSNTAMIWMLHNQALVSYNVPVNFKNDFPIHYNYILCFLPLLFAGVCSFNLHSMSLWSTGQLNKDWITNVTSPNNALCMSPFFIFVSTGCFILLTSST